MAPPKRKSFFKSEYSNEFQGITKSKTGDEFAHCVPCNFDISLLSIGKAAIPHHLKTKNTKKQRKLQIPLWQSRHSCQAHQHESAHLQFSEINTLNYVDKWFRVERFPTNLKWISLKEKKVNRAEVMSLAEQIIAPEVNDNELFDEITALNEILESISDEKFGEMNAEQKWMKVFEAELPNLVLLVNKILSIPVSNACVERVFSLCSAQLTDVRNLLKVETVKSGPNQIEL